MTVLAMTTPAAAARSLTPLAPHPASIDAAWEGTAFDKELVQTPWGAAWKYSGVTGTLSYYTELDEEVLW